MSDDKQFYFIAGYPRSRTGWLANLMTYGPSFCYFEACANPDRKNVAKGYDTLVKRMNNTKAQYVGDSDSALMFFLPELFVSFPQANWVWVQRNRLQAQDSYWKFARRENLPKECPSTIADIERSYEVMAGKLDLLGTVEPKRLVIVQYDELDHPEVCERVWNHCVPTEKFHMERWRLLDKLRLNVIPHKQMQAVEQENNL